MSKSKVFFVNTGLCKFKKIKTFEQRLSYTGVKDSKIAKIVKPVQLEVVQEFRNLTPWDIFGKYPLE